MLFDFTIIGFGVIGTETLNGVKKILLKKPRQHKKINIAIIEKNLNNIPGGIAYSRINSKFGFFNNPLRLSHPDFIKWFNLKVNKKRLINFSMKNPSYSLKIWAKKHDYILNNQYKYYKEIYLPRLVYSFYLKDKILEFLDCKKKNNISLKIFKGEVKNLKKNKYYSASPKSIFKEFTAYKNENNLILHSKEKKEIKIIKSKKLIIGTGIIPPKKITEKVINRNSNYIRDLYSSGGTNNLIKKIGKVSNIKKNLKIIFIGNKAGLLETMQEIEKIINKGKINIKLICISKNTQTLQKAERSKKFILFKLKYLIKNKIDKIKKAEQILQLLKKEFKNAKLKGFNKYDVWTNVLNNKIMTICYNRLSSKEKKNYNFVIFPLIRNITRFTYPDTVSSKNRLKKTNKIKFIKEKVVKIIKKKNILLLETVNKKSIKGDIVINVSGPASVNDLKKEIEFAHSLKKITKKFNNRGFSTNKNFMVEKGLFLPGTLSNNFNPGRETIIKAITKNSHKVAKTILF